MTKYTPGTWEVIPRDDFFIYAGDYVIAKLFHGNEGNALLIAAAPELLKALRCAVECINAGCKRRAPDANNGRGVATTDERRALEYARKAIEKAEGKKAL